MADYPHILIAMMTKERETADVEHLFIIITFTIVHSYQDKCACLCLCLYILDAMGSEARSGLMLLCDTMPGNIVPASDS